MKYIQLLIAILLLPIIPGHAQNIPDGYLLQYQQNFSAKNAVQDFKFSDAGSWRISVEKGNNFLEFTDTGLYQPPVLSPGIIAIVDDRIWGDFILEANVMQTGQEPAKRSMCILFSIKDSAKYYYVDLSSGSDENSNGIFLVNNKPVVKIGTDSIPGINWGNNKWHKVRIERNIVTRNVKVFFDNMEQPFMESTDWNLVMGYVGFGSFSDKGRIDNIKIWSQTSIPEPAGFFRKK